MKHTRILMILSAAWLLILALAFSFAGTDLLVALGVEITEAAAPVLELLGAALLGLALMNWMAKGSMIGGIYARPLAAGNFIYFAVASLSSLKPLIGGTLSPALIAVFAVQLVFAVAFGWLLFGQGAACVGSGGDGD